MVEPILILTIIGTVVGLITAAVGATTGIIVSKNCIELRSEANSKKCTQHTDAEKLTFYTGNENDKNIVLPILSYLQRKNSKKIYLLPIKIEKSVETNIIHFNMGSHFGNLTLNYPLFGHITVEFENKTVRFYFKKLSPADNNFTMTIEFYENEVNAVCGLIKTACLYYERNHQFIDSTIETIKSRFTAMDIVTLKKQ